MSQHGPGILKERTTGFREFDAPWLAEKQLHVELSLHGLDLLAEWWLLHPEALSRSCDMALLRNGDEVPEVSQFHAISKRYEFCGCDIIAHRLSRSYPMEVA